MVYPAEVYHETTGAHLCEKRVAEPAGDSVDLASAEAVEYRVPDCSPILAHQDKHIFVG